MMELTRLQYIESGICPTCKKRALVDGYKQCLHCRKLKRRNARKHSSKNRQQYLEKGICPACRTNPLESDKTRCSTCLKKEADRINKKRKISSQQICSRCLKNPVEDEYKLCQSCRKGDKQRYRKFYNKRTKQGLCISCGNKKEDDNYKSCAQCRQKQTKRASNLYHKRKAEGLCTTCGKEREEHTPSSILCVPCWSKSRARRRKSHSKNNFGGLLETIIQRDKGCVVCKRPYGSRQNSVVCHHIDGNRSNNTLGNLILLCRRCHGVAEGWKVLSPSNRSKMSKFLLKYYPIE